MISYIDSCESNIGNKVILNGDTLMITDYSFIDDNYTLEDGKQISVKLLKKIEVIEN